MNGLLPCPFCGSDDVTETNDVGLTESSIVSYTVVCGDCGAGFSFGMKYERWEAIRAWNTRSAYETDDYFYLPKPKEKLVSVSSPIITEIENGVRVSVGISAIYKAVRKWQEEIERNSDKEIIKRICEVFNPERTCHAIRDESTQAIKCSNCGGGGLTIPSKGQSALRNFCPNCGRRIQQ